MLRWMRRRWRYLAAGGALLVGGALAIYLTVGQRPGDVLNTNVPFTAPAPAPTATTPAPKKLAELGKINWPLYGYDLQRTRYLPAADARYVKPPFRQVWVRAFHDLMEFQPILYKGTMFFIKNNGTAYALRTRTGRQLWKRRIGSLAASSPAWLNGHVFFTTLSGRIYALNASNG